MVEIKSMQGIKKKKRGSRTKLKELSILRGQVELKGR